MALEAHSKARINTILSKVRAQRFLVEKYLSGDLDVESEAEHEAEGRQDATRGNAPSQRCRLTPSQTKLMEEIQVGVQNAMVAASATSDEEFEDAVLAAQSKRMLFASGLWHRQNTVHHQIRAWTSKGARAAHRSAGLCHARQAPVHRHRHGGLLFHRDLSEALGILTQYDLVVLDEVSMLTAAQFDRVLGYVACGRAPALHGFAWRFLAAARRGQGRGKV